MILETARSIREDFLHQNSFHEVDTYTSLHKQYRMMKLILTFYKEANEAIKQGVTIQKLTKMACDRAYRPCKICGRNERR